MAAGIAVVGAGGCGSGSTVHGIAVPNVIGAAAARATAELEGAGLHVATRVRWTGDRIARVLAQQPVTGTVSRGHTVSLVVSSHGRLVPTVVGLPARTAAARLRRRGFVVRGAAPAIGVVSAQAPQTGWSRPHAAVHLRVVTGNAAVIVEVERAFAAHPPDETSLADVRCSRAPPAGVFKCSGFSRMLDYRISEVVAFTGGKVELWQPPLPPKTKSHHGHHRRHGHGSGGGHGHGHGHAHAHAHHGGHKSGHTTTHATTTGSSSSGG